ncbi:hypothetical protein LEMLEM_LOCUS11808, partial [Lemmus lemmus]
MRHHRLAQSLVLFRFLFHMINGRAEVLVCYKV